MHSKEGNNVELTSATVMIYFINYLPVVHTTMLLQILILALKVLCLIVDNANGDEITPNIVSDGEITATLSKEKRLLRFLTKRYQLVGKGGPPVMNSSEAVTVKFGLGLVQLDLEEKSKILVTSMWTRYVWRDLYMVWDPQEFQGITSVSTSNSQNWK